MRALRGSGKQRFVDDNCSFCAAADDFASRWFGSKL
jgi:hypothetical protein